MLRNILLLTLLAGLLPAAARTNKVKNPEPKTFVYRYYLRDKAGTEYSLDAPRRFLSSKSLHRRERQRLTVDSTDIPVCKAYIRQFVRPGCQVIGTSRWQNTVLVRSADSLLLDSLCRLPLVRDSRCVFVAPDSIEPAGDIIWNVHEEFNLWDSIRNEPYGAMRHQIEAMGGVSLHEAGFRGRGMTIAILDGGFQNYNRIPALQRARILGTHDFVTPPMPQPSAKAKNKKPRNVSPFHAIDHGTKVFSAIGAYAPEVAIGTAPDAFFWLFRCEDPATEQPIEEDYWTMAAEMADSVGADIINSSLGYYDYDGDNDDYRLQDLDGNTAFISRSASLLARKGIVLCNSAGNAGMGQWKKIGVPADARDILTVGAIDRKHNLAPFSSIGPSQDGRIKPDVVALGASVALISGRGTLVYDMGTSFSTPLVCGLVACLWQAFPDKTALEIIDMVRHCADQHNCPTNIFGYGMPDFRHLIKDDR